MRGANAFPRKNVLIIQESDKAAPDDSLSGGALIFLFKKKTYVQSVGLLDMDSKYIFLGLTHFFKLFFKGPFRGLGDNSYEAVRFRKRAFLKVLALVTFDSGAITHLDLCVEDHRYLRENEEDERDLQEEVDTSEADPQVVDMAMKFVEDPDNLDMTGWTDYEEMEGEEVVEGEDEEE